MGAVYVNDGGTWKCMNFSPQQAIWCKDGSTWKELNRTDNLKKMFVKDAGTWEQVYASTNTTWTTAELGSTASQGAYDPIDFDGSYPYTNVTSAATEVRWTGPAPGSGSDYGRNVFTEDFGWAASDLFGADYGAIERIEIALDAQYITPLNAGSVDFRTKPDASIVSVGEFNVGSSMTQYTNDYVVGSGGWDIAHDEAGDIFRGTAGVEVRPKYYAGSGTQDSAIQDVEVRIKYRHI